VELAHLGKNTVAGVVEALGTGALLVLDNCEHVLAGAADLVATLVAMTRDLRILTTSRAPLGLSSESVYLLPELDQATTEELFRQRATAARPGVDLPDDAVARLCARLDGLPLAVELAAARVRVLSVAEIDRRLADRFALLRGGRRDAPERHHTLQAVVDWSWDLLDADARRALRALSVFPDGFTAGAADHLLGDDSFDTLEHLVDQSLLKVVDTPTGVRFRMLETVREFGAARLAESGDTDRAVDGLLAWARDLAVRHHDSVFGPDPVPIGDLLRADQDNLRQALHHALARADGASVAAVTAVLAAVWIIDSNFDRVALLTSASAQVLAHYRPESEHLDVTYTAVALTLFNALAAQAPGTARMLYVLRRLPPATPDTAPRALATVLAHQDVFAADRATLRAFVGGGEPHAAAVAGIMLSYLAEQEADLPAAIDACAPMLAAWATSATPWLWILSLARLGELVMRADGSEAALAYFAEAIRLLDDIGAPRDVVGLYWGMMLANLRLGRLEDAEHWLGLATADNSGSPEDDVDLDPGAFQFLLAARAELALARGEVDEGLRLWRRAMMSPPEDDADQHGVRPWVLETWSGALGAHAKAGRLDLVPDLVTELPRQLELMLANPLERPPVYILEQQLAGAALIALGMADLASGATASAARLVALAERFRYRRGFRPTPTIEDVRVAVEDIAGPAYADAVSEYAGLDRARLRQAALAALRARS
jgi:predicted ATPase/tetratricopeptide (TPR) repeat protein